MIGKRITDRDLFAEGGAVWLLEVEWAGVTYRWASALNDGDTLVLEDENGNDLPYRGGLSIGWQTRFSLFDESAAPPAISLELWFEEDDDIPGRVSAGHDLATMTASLYRWTPAMTHAQRRGVFFGQAREPSYGGTAEPVRVTFESPVYRDGAKWPDGYIAPTTIGGDDGVDQRPYPIVFGSPGLTDPALGGGQDDLGSPAYAYDATNKKILAGYLYGSTGPTLYNVTTGVTVAATGGYETDAQGRLVYTLTTSPALTITDEFGIHWSGDAYGAGDLLGVCARASTLRADLAALEAVKPALNAYKLRGYIDTETSPFQWYLRNILPLLPASAYYGPNGVAVRVWNDSATTADAVASIDAQVNAVRVGPVQYENQEIANEVIVRYAPDFAGGLTKTVTVTGRESAGTYPEVILNPYAVASVSRMAALDAAGKMRGVRQKVIETPFVFDQSTAIRIASWMIKARSTHRRVITVEDPTGHLEWLQDGQHVTYTDSELSMIDELAIVRGRRWAGGRFFLELAIIDDVLAR